MNPGNETAQVCAGQVGPLPHENSPVEQILEISVIWKIIGSYLNVGDLKACRIVNSGFHGMVMKETNFLQRSIVSLKPHQITRDHFGSTSEPWKNVSLKFGNPPGKGSYNQARFNHKRLEWLYPLISNVEALSLRMDRVSKEDGFHHILKRLLIAPKKLRSLAMEPVFLTDVTMEEDSWEDALINLEEFQILQPPLWWQEIGKNRRMLNMSVWMWPVSINYFGKMSKIRALKSFNRIRPSLSVYNRTSTRRNLFECVMSSILIRQIAVANRSSVKQMMFSGAMYHSCLRHELNDMDECSFPSLESATFYDLGSCDFHLVSKHLLILPKLKELEFSVWYAMPITVLNAIEQVSDGLRKLTFKGSGFKDANWQFLQKTKINEFQLELTDFWDGEMLSLPDEVLSRLPLTIRRLFLRGSLESNPIPALARLNQSLVTQLTFIDSGDYFTDDTMRYIVENFRMLRKLNVTNAKRLTDTGFVGSSSKSGSLSGIKGLRTLVLNECGSITDLTLREIRFLELHYLDLSCNKALTTEGYEGLLCTNPSLETLLMSCKDIYDRKNEMYASHPRLSSVAYNP